VGAGREDDQPGLIGAIDPLSEQARHRPMAKETVYIVQTYVAGRGKGLKAEQQVGCKSAEEARRKAERLGPLRLGVVAFAATADVELGDYDEDPVILFKSGQLPHPFGD
jgi:hypothetical protein